MKILLCGEHSFAATGLYEKLTAAGFMVECFSRGTDGKSGNHVSGDVFTMSKNHYLSKYYDIIINFIIIKNKPVAENIRYIQELDHVCELKKVNRLIQISSISVYANDLLYVNEETEIASNYDTKGEYAAIKIAVDQFLLHKKTTYPVTFIRPGYIVCNDTDFSYAGIGICLPLNMVLLLGNQKTSLPLIRRDRMHDALVKSVCMNALGTVLVLENAKGTKYQFLKSKSKRIIIPLPKPVILFISFIANKLSVISTKQWNQIKGLFKETCFDSSKSEKELEMKF
jgi:nucleoside-diphosphate-sugar epimerase